MKAKPFPRIIDTLAPSWKDSNQIDIDAQVALEALLAEFGIERTLHAIKKQGMSGSYRYVVEPFYEEAVRRRKARCRL